MGASLGLWGGDPDDEGDDTEETGGSAETTHTEEVPGGLVDGIKLTSRSGSRGSRGSKGGGKSSASTRSSMDESQESVEEEEAAARPERVAGLIPFTSVPFEVSFADEIFDEALIHGWLSVIDRADQTRRERWCAVHLYFIYEFEPLGGEMVLKRSVPLDGCICYSLSESLDSFVVSTYALFSDMLLSGTQNELIYTVDEPDLLQRWVKAVTLSTVIKTMTLLKRVPRLIQEAVEDKDRKEAKRAARRERRAAAQGLVPHAPHPTPHTPYPTPHATHPTPHTLNSEP